MITGSRQKGRYSPTFVGQFFRWGGEGLFFRWGGEGPSLQGAAKLYQDAALPFPENHLSTSFLTEPSSRKLPPGSLLKEASLRKPPLQAPRVATPAVPLAKASQTLPRATQSLTCEAQQAHAKRKLRRDLGSTKLAGGATSAASVAGTPACGHMALPEGSQPPPPEHAPSLSNTLGYAVTMAEQA